MSNKPYAIAQTRHFHYRGPTYPFFPLFPFFEHFFLYFRNCPFFRTKVLFFLFSLQLSIYFEDLNTLHSFLDRNYNPQKIISNNKLERGLPFLFLGAAIKQVTQG